MRQSYDEITNWENPFRGLAEAQWLQRRMAQHPVKDSLQAGRENRISHVKLCYTWEQEDIKSSGRLDYLKRNIASVADKNTRLPRDRGGPEEKDERETN